MPTDDVDPVQDAKHARETIPARPPTLTELHRRWMHARLAYEEVARKLAQARDAEAAAGRALDAAVNDLAEVLLADAVAGLARRTRRRTVALAGEVLDVCELGMDRPGEFLIEPVPVELVPLD